jgi:hypothetical protein
LDDVEDVWIFSERFSFIYMRMVYTCFGKVQDIIQKAFDNLEPGGYLEMQDAIFPPTSAKGLKNTDLGRWAEAVISAGQKNWEGL